MTTVINFFAGPGSGKSTKSAELYAQMKKENYNVELVREWVKKWAYEKRPINKLDQVYINAKQFQQEYPLYGKVDYIITDAPLILGCIYAEKYCDGMPILPLTNFIINNSNTKQINLFLKRSKPYQQIGRYENEDRAKDMDLYIKNYLIKNEIHFIEIDYEDNLISIIKSEIER